MTDRISELIDYLKTKVESAPNQMGFKEVYYGDQTVIVATPTLCIGSATKDSELMPSRLEHMMYVYLIIYHGKVQDVQKNQKEADVFAEDLIDFLHLDPQMGDNVVHAWVSKSESGFAIRSGTLQSMHRLTLSAKTRTVNPFGG